MPGESLLLLQMRSLLSDQRKDAQALFNDAEQIKGTLSGFHVGRCFFGKK